jgi:acetyltransferase-like isoleucine patch superfamily enzyme
MVKENAINISGQVYIGANTIISVRNHDFPKAYSESFLSIGTKTYIGKNNNIRASGGEIKIGENCSISQNVTIVATNHNIKLGQLIKQQGSSRDNNFIIINDDVWIGANSVILPGGTIGKGAVIAAGSIVTKDVEENAIVLGNPAELLRYRE